jgi:hypothetical protein
MLRLIYSGLAVVMLLGVSSGFTGRASHAPAWNAPQVADGTDPTAPPYPLSPQVADGTDPTAPPYPLGPRVADGTDPTAPPYSLGPQIADGTDPTAPPYPLAA